MYLKNEDVKFESVENARGGKGTIRKTSFLTKEEMKEAVCSAKSSSRRDAPSAIMSTKRKEKPIIF